MMILRARAIAILALLLCYYQSASAQFSSDSLHCSILTCGSGEALYSTFGHTAIRVRELDTGADWVFDYGVFDFEESFFVFKFLRGSLRYQLAVRPFEEFYQSYAEEGRLLYEQELLLNATQEKTLYHLLLENYREENRYYYYNFIQDNCATRIRDIIKRSINARPAADHLVDSTYRDCLKAHLGNKPWLEAGIDLALGQTTDELMPEGSGLFLPNGFSAGLNDYLEVRSLSVPVYLLQEQKETVAKPKLTPALFSWSVLGMVILLLLLFPTWRPRFRYYHALIYGLAGSLLLFLWLGTRHTATAQNWNLLWLNPFWLLWVLFPGTNWSSVLRILLLSVAVLPLLVWNWVPQYLPSFIIPLICIGVVIHMFPTETVE